MDLHIGDLAHAAGVPISTIRYYERIGLLEPAARSEARYRLYSSKSVDEVRFIRRAQALGFTLPEVAGLLSLSRQGLAPCDEVVRLGHQHLAALDEKLERLRRFRVQLGKTVQSWSEDGCGFTPEGLCTLIELNDLPDSTDVQITRRPIAKR